MQPSLTSITVYWEGWRNLERAALALVQYGQYVLQERVLKTPSPGHLLSTHFENTTTLLFAMVSLAYCEAIAEIGLDEFWPIVGSPHTSNVATWTMCDETMQRCTTRWAETRYSQYAIGPSCQRSPAELSFSRGRSSEPLLLPTAIIVPDSLIYPAIMVHAPTIMVDDRQGVRAAKPQNYRVPCNGCTSSVDTESSFLPSAGGDKIIEID